MFGGLVWCLVRHGFVVDENPIGRVCCNWVLVTVMVLLKGRFFKEIVDLMAGQARMGPDVLWL